MIVSLTANWAYFPVSSTTTISCTIPPTDFADLLPEGSVRYTPVKILGHPLSKISLIVSITGPASLNCDWASQQAVTRSNDSLINFISTVSEPQLTKKHNMSWKLQNSIAKKPKNVHLPGGMNSTSL